MGPLCFTAWDANQRHKKYMVRHVKKKPGLFTVNRKHTWCCEVYYWKVGYVHSLNVYCMCVCVCWSLVGSGMPAEGRAADGSEASVHSSDLT